VEVLRRAWPEVLQTLTRIKRSTWALVEPNAQVGQFDGQVLTLVFTTSGLAGAFGRADHSENLRQAIHKTIGIDCQITAVAGAGSSASSEPNPKRLLAGTFRLPPPTRIGAWHTPPVGLQSLNPLLPALRQQVRLRRRQVRLRRRQVRPPRPRPGIPLLLRRRLQGFPRRNGQDPPSRHPDRTPPPPHPAAPAGAGSATRAPSITAPAAPVAPVGAGSAAGESGNAPSASPQQPASQPVATQASAEQPAAKEPTASQAPVPQSSAGQGQARGPQQQTGDYSYPDDDWGPPLDEDAPPLEEEPPMDWEPSRQWQSSPAPSSAPEIKAPEAKQPVESAPSAAQTRAKTAAPAQGGGPACPRHFG
jgi:DNA polymerase-3 subunit gamma/tau